MREKIPETRRSTRIKSRKKLVLIALLLVFILPILAAKLLFSFRSSFSIPVKHYGELITPPKLISALELDSKTITLLQNALGKWQIVYLRSPNRSDESQNENHKEKKENGDHTFELLKRVRMALGKHQSAVVTQQIPYTHSFPWKENSILIVDPKGFLMMVYPPFGSVPALATIPDRADSNSAEFPTGLSQARGILQDLRRLLRFSHD